MMFRWLLFQLNNFSIKNRIRVYWLFKIRLYNGYKKQSVFDKKNLLYTVLQQQMYFIKGIQVSIFFLQENRLLLPILTTKKYYNINPKLNRQPFERVGLRESFKRDIVLPSKSSPKVLNELHSYWYTTPGNLGNSYALGFLLLFGITLQIFTGVLLVANYEPTILGAWESIQWIKRDVFGGWWVQSTHAIGASLLFIALYIHIFRGLYLASYKKKTTWLTGIGIYFLIALIAFLGYCLPWGQMSLWGCKVITSFLTTIPYTGITLVEWVWGGSAINDNTLKRFYMAHIVLNGILLFLIGIHIRALHKDGSSSPLSTTGSYSVEFSPYILIKDTFMICLYLSGSLLTIIYDTNIFSHAENFIVANPLLTPDQIVPEWYFLPFYAILRSIPNKTDGLLAMIGSIMIWAILPWLYGSEYRSTYDILGKLGYWIYISVVLLLGWLGAQPLRSPFLELSLILAYTYFLYFLVYLPVITIPNLWIILYIFRYSHSKLRKHLTIFSKPKSLIMRIVHTFFFIYQNYPKVKKAVREMCRVTAFCTWYMVYVFIVIYVWILTTIWDI